MLNKWHRQSLILASVASVLIGVWFVYNLDRGDGMYHMHKQLYDEVEHKIYRIKDLMNLTAVFDRPADYIKSTDSVRRLYNEIGTVSFMLGLPLDQRYQSREEAQLAGYPVANSTKCGEQLDWIRGKLQQHPAYFQVPGREGYELTSLMDAFGRPEPGLFSHGAESSLGSYDYCRQVTLRRDQIKGHYCIGLFRFKTWPAIGLSRVDHEQAIRIGLCLPETCDSLSTIDQYNETVSWLAKQQMPELLANSLELYSMFCLPHEQSPMRQMSSDARIFLYIILAWTASIFLISILYEYLWRHELKQTKKKSTMMRLLNGFTLRNSIKSFTIWRKPNPESRVNLALLDFTKLMMAFAVLTSHAVIFSIYKAKTRRGMIELSRHDMVKFIIPLGRFVDTFLTIFGITMSYTLLQKFDIRKLGNPFLWLSANLAIFLRLAPVHALILIFNRLIGPYLGSGPWWDYGVDSQSAMRVCSQSNWKDLIPFNANLGEYPAPPCNPPSWFLGAYCQIALILPYLIYVIGNLPTKLIKFLFVALLAIISAANIAVKIYSQQVLASDAIADYGAFMVALVERYETTGYMDTLGRLGSVIIGCYAGYLLHLYQVSEIQEWPRWFRSKLFQFLMLLLHATLFLTPLIGNRLQESDSQTNQDDFAYESPSSVPMNAGNPPEVKLTTFQFALINFFMIPLWPIINCLVIMAACTTYKNHVAIRFMSHPVWCAANKIGLGIYLIHYEVLIVSLTFYDGAPSNGSPFEAFRLAGFAMTATVTLSIIVYLLFEAPLAYLVAKFIMPAIQRVGGGGGVRSKIDRRLRDNLQTGTNDANNCLIVDINDLKRGRQPFDRVVSLDSKAMNFMSDQDTGDFKNGNNNNNSNDNGLRKYSQGGLLAKLTLEDRLSQLESAQNLLGDHSKQQGDQIDGDDQQAKRKSFSAAKLIANDKFEDAGNRFER